MHFEVTVESFRRAAVAGQHELAVVDADTGRVVFDSEFPQRVGAPLGRPGDRRFVSLAGHTGASGTLDSDGARMGFVRLDPSRGNANRWYVVAVSGPVAASGLLSHLPTFGLIGAVLLLVAFGMGRRWARVNRDLLVQQTRSEQELRAGEER